MFNTHMVTLPITLVIKRDREDNKLLLQNIGHVISLAFDNAFSFNFTLYSGKTKFLPIFKVYLLLIVGKFNFRVFD